MELQLIPQFILNRKLPEKDVYFDKQKSESGQKKWSEKHGPHFKSQGHWQAATCRTRHEEKRE